MEKNGKIYVAGHTGLLGSSLERVLRKEGYENLVLSSSSATDLRDQKTAMDFFEREKPEYVFLCAARVGGLFANDKYRADFIYDNIQIQTNVIRAAWKNNVRKLLFYGSNCMYPKASPQPIKEEYLLTGPFEPTNQAYAIAKMAGIEMCRAYRHQYGNNFIAAIPANMYGPNDNYNEGYSHMIPDIMNKCHKAKVLGGEVNISGSENRIRDFIYVDDVAEASLFLMQNYDSAEPINIASGQSYKVGDVAEMIRKVVGFDGKIIFDLEKPTGMLLKCLDSTKMNSLGWKAKIDLEDGLERTYGWFLNTVR